MKGIISACITFAFIYTCLCQCDFNTTFAIENGDKYSDCRNASLNTANIENGQTHCCLFVVAGDGANRCGAVTDDQYDNIKTYKKYLNEFKPYNEDVEIKKIKCGSNYLSYSLFVISILALIF